MIYNYDDGCSVGGDDDEGGGCGGDKDDDCSGDDDDDDDNDEDGGGGGSGADGDNKDDYGGGGGGDDEDGGGGGDDDNDNDSVGNNNDNNAAIEKKITRIVLMTKMMTKRKVAVIITLTALAVTMMMMTMTMMVVVVVTDDDDGDNDDDNDDGGGHKSAPVKLLLSVSLSPSPLRCMRVVHVMCAYGKSVSRARKITSINYSNTCHFYSAMPIARLSSKHFTHTQKRYAPVYTVQDVSNHINSTPCKVTYKHPRNSQTVQKSLGKRSSLRGLSRSLLNPAGQVSVVATNCYASFIPCGNFQPQNV